MPQHFDTTRWTLVLDAGKSNAEASRPALELLCHAYWQPLYAYVRRSGRDHEDAQDTTQAFFAHLLGSNLPGRADPKIGRFRTFLLSALRNFMLSEHRDANRLKRGGGTTEHLPIEDHSHLLPDTSTDSPDTAYERQGAQTLVNIALDELGQQQSSSGNHARYSLLRPLLLDSADAPALQSRLISEHGMTEGSIRTALTRLRARFRDLVRQEVARLVDDPADVEDELAHLLRAMG